MKRNNNIIRVCVFTDFQQIKYKDKHAKINLFKIISLDKIYLSIIYSIYHIFNIIYLSNHFSLTN